MKIIAYLILIATVAACGRVGADKPINRADGWNAVYQHDEKGKAVRGSIDSLIAGIRNGYAVRIGWGWQKELGDSILRLEHMAKPIFLSVIQEKNVSAIINVHPMLKSYIHAENQVFDDSGQLWQCVLTTQGTFNAQVYDRMSGDLIKDWPQRHRMTWFLEYPSNQNTNNKPLFE